MSNEFYALKRKAVSIRDVFNIIEFMRVNFHHIIKGNIGQCFRHGSELVIVDGVCLGIDTGGVKEQNSIIDACQSYIEKIMLSIYGQAHFAYEMNFINSKKSIGVGSFTLPKIKALAKPS